MQRIVLCKEPELCIHWQNIFEGLENANEGNWSESEYLKTFATLSSFLTYKSEHHLIIWFFAWLLTAWSNFQELDIIFITIHLHQFILVVIVSEIDLSWLYVYFILYLQMFKMCWWLDDGVLIFNLMRIMRWCDKLSRYVTMPKIFFTATLTCLQKFHDGTGGGDYLTSFVSWC